MVICADLIGKDCDWQIIAFVRSGLACLFAAILAVAAGSRLVLFRPRVLWWRSLAGSCSMICTFYAFTRMPPEDVVTLTNMFPIWVALLSWPLAQEAPTPAVWLSVACGVSGVVLIQGPQIALGNYGAFAAVAASVFSAFAMLGLNRLRGIDTRAIVVHFSGVAALTCLASYFVFDHRDASPFAVEPRTLGLLLAVGVSATVGQLFLTKAFASSSAPAKVSVLGLTQVVFVMAIKQFIRPHDLTWQSVVGTVLIVAPTAWMLLRRGGVFGAKKTPAESRGPVSINGSRGQVKVTSSLRPSADAISSAAPAPRSSSGRSGTGRAVAGSS
jgi:drug/metabolite transporter (DMT)-like permease